MSSTAFVSERIAGTFIAGSVDPVRNIKVPDVEPPMTPSIASIDSYFEAYCDREFVAADWEVTAGRYWLYSGFAFTLYNHVGSPNDKRPSCQRGTLRDYGIGGLCPPRSLHRGGVNVLMGDGSVQAVSDGVAPPIWAAMGTRNGGD